MKILIFILLLPMFAFSQTQESSQFETARFRLGNDLQLPSRHSVQFFNKHRVGSKEIACAIFRSKESNKNSQVFESGERIAVLLRVTGATPEIYLTRKFVKEEHGKADLRNLLQYLESAMFLVDDSLYAKLVCATFADGKPVIDRNITSEEVKAYLNRVL